eukprot:Gb_27272 [translate_table: standard]
MLSSPQSSFPPLSSIALDPLLSPPRSLNPLGSTRTIKPQEKPKKALSKLTDMEELLQKAWLEQYKSHTPHFKVVHMKDVPSSATSIFFFFTSPLVLVTINIIFIGSVSSNHICAYLFSGVNYIRFVACV